MNASAPVAVSAADAARMTGVSERTIRRAIQTSDPAAFPPPLKAHRKGHGPSAPYVIRTVDLDAWVASWPTA